jgi:hypothetical protein
MIAHMLGDHAASPTASAPSLIVAWLISPVSPKPRMFQLPAVHHAVLFRQVAVVIPPQRPDEADRTRCRTPTPAERGYDQHDERRCDGGPDRLALWVTLHQAALRSRVQSCIARVARETRLRRPEKKRIATNETAGRHRGRRGHDGPVGDDRRQDRPGTNRSLSQPPEPERWRRPTRRR